MSNTLEKWRKIYKEKHYKIYEDFTGKLSKLINDFFQQNAIGVRQNEFLHQNNIRVHQVEKRTKTVAGFIKKIKEKNYSKPLEEITDLTGIRIITYYKDDVDIIGEIIKNEFIIDWKNSIDKAQTLDRLLRNRKLTTTRIHRKPYYHLYYFFKSFPCNIKFLIFNQYRINLFNII